MKKLATIKKLCATALAVFAFGANSFALNEDNLGAACGCPAISTRGAAINLNTLGNINVNGEYTTDVHLTCDKKYLLNQKIYVGNGVTLTIDPGVLIQGHYDSDPVNAAALIVERGGKIIADGTKECYIVMTSDEDNMLGTYSLTNVGRWGGLVLLGRAYNNLTSTANVGGSGATCNLRYCTGTTGVGFVEGFNGSNLRDNYGFGDSFTRDDHDNSGILRYVSIRHSGAVLPPGDGNELNGLSLASVGDGTTIEHIEIVSSGDDGIEFFGGTVNVKYASVLFSDDDMFDWDLGYTGKMQFLFGIQADSLNTGNQHTSDNGFEADADDNNGVTVVPGLTYSHPVIYNATLISNGHSNPASDNTGPAGIQGKECTQGEIYNSIFANWRAGCLLKTARSTGPLGGDTYDNWSNAATAYNQGAGGTFAVSGSFKVKNNVFISNTTASRTQYPYAIGNLCTGKNTSCTPAGLAKVNPTIPSGTDDNQFYTVDGNTSVSSVLGIDPVMAFNVANTTLTDPFHATPKTNLISNIIPPTGFFTQVNYKGAFDANSSGHWLSDWSAVQLQTLAASNPTDINQDGITDITDFGIFVGKYNQLDK